MAPGLFGWNPSSGSYVRTNWRNADIYNMSGVPVLTHPNYQDTAMSMRTALFDESIYSDLFMSNTVGVADLRSTMHDVYDPWNGMPFNIGLSGC